MNELNELRTGSLQVKAFLASGTDPQPSDRGNGFIKVLDVASRSGHGGSYGREAGERG